jgi:putative transposase
MSKNMGVSNRSHGMRFAPRRLANDAGIDWLLFYNHRRLHATPGYPGPTAFAEKRFANQQRRAASSLSCGGP